MRWTVDARIAARRLGEALDMEVTREAGAYQIEVPNVSPELSTFRETSAMRMLAFLVGFAMEPIMFGGPGMTPAEVSEAIRFNGRLPQGSRALTAHLEHQMLVVLGANK